MGHLTVILAFGEVEDGLEFKANFGHMSLWQAWYTQRAAGLCLKIKKKKIGCSLGPYRKVPRPRLTISAAATSSTPSEPEGTLPSPAS